MASSRLPRMANGAAWADCFLADGLISREARDAAVQLHRRTSQRIEECLLDLKAVREADLMRYLAARHSTRFVSSKKLSNAHIPASTLGKVALRLAERYGVFPVLFDATTNTLSVATADPDNVEALDQIRKGAGAREIVALIARPAAVEAAIRKFYQNDPLGFAAFETGDAVTFALGDFMSTGGTEFSRSSSELSDAIELDVDSMKDFPLSGRLAIPDTRGESPGRREPPIAPAPAPAAPAPAAPAPAAPPVPRSNLLAAALLAEAIPVDDLMTEPPAPPVPPAPPAPAPPAPAPPAPAPPAPLPAARPRPPVPSPSPEGRAAGPPPPPPRANRSKRQSPLPEKFRSVGNRPAFERARPGAAAARDLGSLPAMPAMPVMPATPATPTTPTTPTTNERADQSSTVLAQKEPAKNRPEVPPELDFATSDVLLETLNVLVTLIENARSDLRGHSAHVARLARKIAEHMGFARPEVNALLASAYLHDVAKAGKYHLTALNVAQYENPRSTAQKVYANPYRLLENVRLAPQTVAALEGMYEKFDGTGLPHQKAGKEIPLFARLLAVCDTFVDLTVNANNPFGRILKPGEACEVLSRYKGSIFDPSLVDLLRVTVTGDDVRARILADRPVALLVDPDPEETMVLELRMAEQGFEVRVARSAEQALKMLESSEIEIVVAEIELGSAQPDGLWLLNEARKADWGRNLPWLVLSRRQGRTDAEAAFALGVVDYVPKPAPEDVLVAKLKQALERGGTARAQRGVAGSLREMGIPDLVQILFYGRKSGALLLRKGPDNGALYFAEGMVVHAVWGNLSGADAFYGLLRLREGEFSFDPSGRTDKVTINESPESLLLEGMRRMDEG